MTHTITIELDEGAYVPERAYPTDAGLDLRAISEATVPAHGYLFIDTGVHVDIPNGTRGHICSKSGLNRYHGLTADGTVDCGYSGTVGVTVHNDGDRDYTFHPGDKIAQLVIEEIRILEPVIGHVTPGKRGHNGYGSSGR